MQRFGAGVKTTRTHWLWVGAKAAGYGRFHIRGRRAMVPAHRVAYELLVGPVLAGVEIDHTCHVKDCVNPDHLRAVLHKQNQENRAGAQANSRSGIRGVFWHRGKWLVRVQHNGRPYHGGRFTAIADAEQAAIALRNKLFTHNDADRRAQGI
jgi:hypothetical protein